MKYLVLLGCLAVFHAASGLECYSCDTETCKNDMKEWGKNKCGGSADTTLEPACQKIVFKDKDGKEVVNRKCATVPKTGEAPCPTTPQGATDVKCPVCKTDLCNTAASVQYSFAAAATVFFAFLFM
ncbi:unnamed protein product [Phyllotreta striolata]|uniref:Uncharacterized protein n=1 Tax=Phyllotreta striolata TaxID=444603 RepID=A0A9N9TJM4_PHYSR|nr:unnamed protein product [Phyllotreta striolata]